MADNNERVSGPFTGVEHSDGRLAAAEEAKRTGLEFRSTGAKGADLVTYTTAVEAGNEWSSEVVAERDQLGDALESATKDINELNAMKAKAHEDYSNQVIERRFDRPRMEVAERVDAIVKRNDQIQAQHEEQSNAVADRLPGEERVPLRAEQVEDGEPVTIIGQQELKRGVTDISESEERSMLDDKGRVAYGEVPFEAFVDVAASVKENRSEERSVPQPHQAGELTSGPRSAGKKSGESKDDEQAQREAEKAEREQAREKQKAEREERKAQEKARREEEKRQRQEAEKAAEEAAAAEQAANNSGDSQE